MADMPDPATHAVTATDLPLPNRRQGKVRDIYDVPSPPTDGGGEPGLLIVATDRLSAFDVVLPTPIPGKGRLLTSISTAWFRWIESRGLAKTHLLSTDPADVPGLSEGERASIEGRMTLGRRCRVIPVECVARGYIEGSGWRDYQKTGTVCGHELPKGLRQGDALPEPIFTPATKAQVGEHDENITFERACEIAGEATMNRLRETTLAIYRDVREYAHERGIVLADTKFEFGIPVDASGSDTSDEPILIDEALTPDSSRFWDADQYEPGHEQKSFDKQFVREYLQRLVDAGKWNKAAPGPELPQEIVEGTLARYREARDRLFG